MTYSSIKLSVGSLAAAVVVVMATEGSQWSQSVSVPVIKILRLQVTGRIPKGPDPYSC